MVMSETGRVRGSCMVYTFRSRNNGWWMGRLVVNGEVVRVPLSPVATWGEILASSVVLVRFVALVKDGEEEAQGYCGAQDGEEEQIAEEEGLEAEERPAEGAERRGCCTCGSGGAQGVGSSDDDKRCAGHRQRSVAWFQVTSLGPVIPSVTLPSEADSVENLTEVCGKATPGVLISQFIFQTDTSNQMTSDIGQGGGERSRYEFNQQGPTITSIN
ncbi:hypothetical protein FB45DRAFT_1004813 [Roridomyces roridus]|uniref:Uncharacterized protein n=1 Tax=Roridomyces roridus TaxID=1738132 RepID=A0AAD7FJI4_9AGAR|nr:hypothetical protein FB45DRAFT_1004813 [Roridomyces roridus]